MAEPKASKVSRRAQRRSKRGAFWRSPDPKPAYGVVIIGGGSLGVATGYYLAREHDQQNVAVIDAGWLGADDRAHDAAIVHAEPRLDANIDLHAQNLKLWQNLSHELGFNVMYSQRGAITLVETPGQEDALAARGNAMALKGLPARMLDTQSLKTALPALDVSDRGQNRASCGLEQSQAGLADHTATVWGYARAADRRGVDIVENCQVTDLILDGARVTGVRTSRGDIYGRKIAIAVPGGASPLARHAGIERLPIETRTLQGLATEPVKRCLDPVVVLGDDRYRMAQSRHGNLVLDGPADRFNSYARIGSLTARQEMANAVTGRFPALARLRVLTQGSETVDETMDGAPIITAGTRPGLYLSVGWGRSAAGAAPVAGWCFAHTIAQNRPHPLAAPFSLDRFHRGFVLNETPARPMQWLN